MKFFCPWWYRENLSLSIICNLGSRFGDLARIKQNGILGQLLRDSWLAFTEGLL